MSHECVFSARFFVKINLFRRLIFRKNVHADFYGLSDIDFVVTNFDPNNLQVKVSSYVFSLLISLFSQSLLILQDH